MTVRVPVHVHAADPISRFGLSAQLRQQPELELVGRDEAGDGTVAVVAAEEMDDDTVRQLRELNRQGCRHAVLVATELADAGLLTAIEVGICALVPRVEASSSRLAQMVLKVASGESALPADMLARLLKQVNRLQHNVRTPKGLTFTGLSARETEVLRLVADGLDTNEIADALSYSSRTVKNILHGVTSRLCLRNRSHAVAYALREGLI